MTADIPSVEDLREWTGEPFLDLPPEMIRLIFGAGAGPEAVSLFREQFWYGSRAGLVNLFVLGHRHHGWRVSDGFEERHAVMAHLAAAVWIEGKVHSALAEFGLEESEGIYAEDLLAMMEPFRCSPVLMGPEDLEAFNALPDVVSVWRGGAGDASDVRLGFSWTTDRAVAKRFAERASKLLSAPPAIVRRRVQKRALVAYFVSRDEGEAVLWPSRYGCRLAIAAMRNR